MSSHNHANKRNNSGLSIRQRLVRWLAGSEGFVLNMQIRVRDNHGLGEVVMRPQRDRKALYADCLFDGGNATRPMLYILPSYAEYADPIWDERTERWLDDT